MVMDNNEFLKNSIMTEDKIKKEKPKVIIYRCKEYSIYIGSNWDIQNINKNQTFFYGPKVGATRIGFYITSVNKDGKTYLDAANRRKVMHQQETDYAILEEQDISKQGYQAFMRLSCWYDANSDMTLFVREIFTESDQKVVILSCSIPNSPDLEELNKTTVQMMNSFRFTQNKKDKS